MTDDFGPPPKPFKRRKRGGRASAAEARLTKMVTADLKVEVARNAVLADQVRSLQEKLQESLQFGFVPRHKAALPRFEKLKCEKCGHITTWERRP